MKRRPLEIFDDNNPFIIAELSSNHNGDINYAKELIQLACESGASAVKLQTFQPYEMTLDSNNSYFKINDPDSLWNKRSLTDLYHQAYTPWEWHEELFRFAREIGITCFSTPSDNEAVDLLESLDCPLYKVASFENCHLPLLRKIASTNKPVIVSTGISSLPEIDSVVSTLTKNGCKKYALLVCVSSYPAKAEDYNLKRINTLREIYGCPVGISDHTLNNVVSISSIIMGGTIIEKHFISDRKIKTLDSAFSIEPDELSLLVSEVNAAQKAMGHGHFHIGKNEKKSLQFKRSIFCSKDIKKGDIITNKNISIVRPGYGLPPNQYDYILGLKANIDITKGTPIKWEFFK